MAPPRVLIVSRRTLRKNKYIDFVAEIHLDLIIANGGAPIIVPRVPGMEALIESLEPIDGVLLCEGEDIHPSHYWLSPSLTKSELHHIHLFHSTEPDSFDPFKDSIELRLAKICFSRSIPLLGICRGSQLINVACGGTLYADVEMEIANKNRVKVKHRNYDDYDGHRHRIRIVQDCPLYTWFDDKDEIDVTSCHHQGVRKLAERFEAMAFADDGLIEGFWDPKVYDPEEGRFLVGLQFHPERMRLPGMCRFQYPGCSRVYKEFMKAVIAHSKKRMSNENDPK